MMISFNLNPAANFTYHITYTSTCSMCVAGAAEPDDVGGADIPRRPRRSPGHHAAAGHVRLQPEGPQRARRPGGHRRPRRREEDRYIKNKNPKPMSDYLLHHQA